VHAGAHALARHVAAKAAAAGRRGGAACALVWHRHLKSCDDEMRARVNERKHVREFNVSVTI
jgi:hypothetical protein